MSGAGRRNSCGSNVDMMQLGSVDQVQAFFAHTLEGRQDFTYRSFHYSLATLVSGEIQIEMFPHETIRHAGEAIEGILNAVAEQLAAKQVVVQGYTQRKLHR